MTLDLDRITHPLRLASGSHQPGSGKGCAMNVVSYINGDVEITDYPSCSARPLALMVQTCNDRLANSDGYLSPKNSLIVLDLGWKTVGTADVPDTVVHAWMAELLDNPKWGVIRFIRGDGIPAISISTIAGMHRKVAEGEMHPAWAWRDREAWRVALSAVQYEARYAAHDSAAYYVALSAIRSATKDEAESAAYSATDFATDSAIKHEAESAAHSAAYFATDSTIEHEADSADLVEFTSRAITAWRELAGLDSPPELRETAVDDALQRIG